MKKFNRTISVEVSVDAIADRLLSQFPEDYKHRELVTEAIIGPLLEADKVSYVYNALNGFTNDIDFEIGDHVDCVTTHYLDGKSVQIGSCIIVDINKYATRKLQVEYEFKSIGKGNITKTAKQWVSHGSCSKRLGSMSERFTSI